MLAVKLDLHQHLKFARHADTSEKIRDSEVLGGIRVSARSQLYTTLQGFSMN